jgi:hypothetical protein
MLAVKPGTLFVRQGTRLPHGMQACLVDNCDWLHAGDASAVEQSLHSAGWHYLQLLGKEQAVTMFGMTPAEALRKATRRALERLPEHRNAAELTNLRMTNVGGVFFATVSAVPRQIQQSAIVDFAEPRGPVATTPQAQTATA